jgi:hypothetical protein
MELHQTTLPDRPLKISFLERRLMSYDHGHDVGVLIALVGHLIDHPRKLGGTLPTLLALGNA